MSGSCMKTGPMITAGKHVFDSAALQIRDLRGDNPKTSVWRAASTMLPYYNQSTLHACSLHWSDLHKALLAALPHGIVHFGTTVTAVEQKDGSKQAVVWAEKRGAATESDGSHPIRMECDLVVAADGSMSDTRRRFRPHESRRSGGATL